MMSVRVLMFVSGTIKSDCDLRSPTHLLCKPSLHVGQSQESCLKGRGRGTKAAFFAWILNWTATQRPIRRDIWPLFWTIIMQSSSGLEINIWSWKYTALVLFIKGNNCLFNTSSSISMISTKVTVRNFECATISAVISKTQGVEYWKDMLLTQIMS